MKKLLTLSCLLSSLVFSSPHPHNPHTSPPTLNDRKTDIVTTWVYNYAESPHFSEWTVDAKRSLRQITAGLYVFAHPQEFSSRDYAALSGLPPEATFEEHLTTYQGYIFSYFQTAEIFETVGTSTSETGQKVAVDGTTGGDYDFILKEVLSILYTFKSRPDILTPEMVSSLLLQGETDPLHFAYSGNELSYSQVYLKDVFMFPTQMGVLPIYYDVKQPETENHMLLIYSWQYLINNYIRWVASLGISHPAYNEAVLITYNQDPIHYDNSEELGDLILQMLGRVVHNGLFETNAKAYEAFTTNAILNLYSYSDETPTTTMDTTIKTAAQNALDYLSAKFAFQSLQGKRIAPMRRNFGYKDRLGYYQNDYMPHMWGILSGNYTFDDTNGSSDFPEIPTNSSQLPYHFSSANQPAGFALWAALSDYRIPKATLDFMHNKHRGMWSKMQSQYTNRHYDVSYTFNIMAQPPEPADIEQRYFNDDGTIFNEGDSRPVTQLQFTTRGFSNVSGGAYQQYNQYIVNLMGMEIDAATLSDGFRQYDALAKPQSLILKGDNGHWDSDIESFNTTTLSLNPHDESFWENNNTLTYKNFSMVTIDTTTAIEEARHFPAQWDEHLATNYTFNTSSVNIYDFKYAHDSPLHGHYVIMGNRTAGSQQQIWWEIVPARYYYSSWILGWSVLLNNYATFMNTEDTGFNYVIAPSYEQIRIAPDNDTTACFTIVDIKSYRGTPIPVNAVHHNSCRNENSGALIDVWQVDRFYNFTGTKYATGRDGLIEIYNPYVRSQNRHVIINSQDYQNPVNNNPSR